MIFKLARGKSKYGSLTEEELENRLRILFSDVENGDSFEVQGHFSVCLLYWPTFIRRIEFIKEHILKKHIRIEMQKQKNRRSSNYY